MNISKGVIANIWEDEDMPVSQHGVRADILITPESPFNRLNSGQFYEQFLSLCSEIVTDRIRSGKIPRDQAYEYVMDYIRDVQPMYAQVIDEEMTTDELKDDLVDAVCEDGIYMIIPPFTKGVDEDLVLHLSKKYGIERGPLTYYRRKPDGSREKIVTRSDGLIGEKYMVLLGKRPIDQLNVIEFGYINQFMAPMKPNSKLAKAQSLYGQTPMRYGEDEVANLTSIIGPLATARILGLYSNSAKALDTLNTKLLTAECPSALPNIGMTTKEVIETSLNVNLLNHQLAEVGYILTPEEKLPFTPPNQE